MTTVAILFISISLTLAFLGDLTETFSSERKISDYIETIWTALLLLAWAYIVKQFL